MTPKQDTFPLVCDLDGTLIRSDTTFELCLLHIKSNPLLGWLQVLVWFLSSKSGAKTRLARLHGPDFNVPGLPFSDMLAEPTLAAHSERALVSGSADFLVQKIATHLGGFSLIKGTDEVTNMIGQNKAEFLKAHYPDGFDYVGDSRADIPVWDAASTGYAYNVSQKTLDAAKQVGVEPIILSREPSATYAVLKGMRLHQWSKNGLLIVPFLLGITHFEMFWVWYLLLGFLAFGLLASATYLLNDLLDIQTDRAHTRKRCRPFASGNLSVPQGMKLITAIALCGLLLSAILSTAFFLMLVVYALISLLYSLYLKQMIILDVVVLSFLFCWRVLAGGVLLDLPNSTWFMVSLGCFFLSLALGKRAIELHRVKAKPSTLGDTLIGRGYHTTDLPVLINAGVSSSIAAIVIIIIYALLSTETIITRDISAVAIATALTLWQLRFWLLVGRDEVHDDPIVFALKDKVSALLFCLMGSVAIVEQLWPLGG